MSHDWRLELETQHGVDRLKHWKKGNQRNSLLRVHAEMAVKDSQLVRAFTSICMHCQVSASQNHNAWPYQNAQLHMMYVLVYRAIRADSQVRTG